MRERLARRRDQKGAALVEAAIIFPLILLLTFGAIEFGLAFNQKGGVESAARSGARVGSTESLTDCTSPTPTPTCPTGPIAGREMGYDIAVAVNAALKTSSINQIDKMYVTRVQGAAPGTDNFTGFTMTCAADCISFSGSTTTKNQLDLGTLSGQWVVANRVACPPAGGTPDRIAVHLKGTYNYLTKLFGGSATLTSTAVLQFEPNC